MRVAAALLLGVAVVSTASVAPAAGDNDAARPLPPRVQTVPVDDDGTAASKPRNTEPFSLLGVTWTGESSPGRYDVAVRTRSGGEWTGWTPLEVSYDEGERGGRAGTAPYWSGASDGVQMRFTVRDGERPEDIELALIDPGRSPADREAAPELQSADQPTIRTRADWGADESLRTDGPRYTSTIKAGFVHHTAGVNDYTEADVPSIIRGIYAYHVKSRRWSDIGYQFLVDKFGRLWEGRYGGVDKPVLGAHAGGFNTNTFGVSALGTFTEAEAREDMQQAIADLMAWKLSRHDRDPQGKTVLVSSGGGTSRYPEGERVTVDVISGHRDVGRTECPGGRLYAALPQIRRAAAAQIEEDVR